MTAHAHTHAANYHPATAVNHQKTPPWCSFFMYWQQAPAAIHLTQAVTPILLHLHCHWIDPSITDRSRHCSDTLKCRILMNNANYFQISEHRTCWRLCSKKECSLQLKHTHRKEWFSYAILHWTLKIRNSDFDINRTVCPDFHRSSTTATV